MAVSVAFGLAGAAAARANAAAPTLQLSAVVTKSSNGKIGFDLLAHGKRVGGTVRDFACAAGPTEVACSGA